MAALTEQTMILTQSQRHWRAWVSALQTRDAEVRAVALEQLGKFLDYWTRELYHPPPSIRGILNGRDTPQPESWEEVFNVDADSLITNRSDKRISHSHLDADEAWVGPYGLDEYTFESHHIDKPLTMNPWDNDDGSKETRETLSRYFCGIQRLVIDCPFADVRRTCRKLLDRAKRKRVEIPLLVNEGPSWLIPISEIIGFKTQHHREEVNAIQIPEKYISDESSSDSDSDIEFGGPSSSPFRDYDRSVSGYSYYTSPDATPRPTFTTPAIPINLPARKHPHHHQHHLSHRNISRNASQDSMVQSSITGTTTSSHKSSERRFPRQMLASAEIREFQISSFIGHGRVTNYAKVLFYMPRYLRCSSTCYEKLISSTRGTLGRGVKLYLAMMAAAEVGCQYFVSYFTAKYLEVGGDSGWLKGINKTPAKVQRIAMLNRKMIQEPWKLTKEDIIAMTEKREVDDGRDEEGWSLSEVVQIITILAMFHTQSSIALALGVVCEADVFGGTIWRQISRVTEDDTFSGDTDDRPKRRGGQFASVHGGRQDIIDKLRIRMMASGHLSPDMSFDNLQNLNLDSTLKSARLESVFRQVLEPITNGGTSYEEPTVLTMQSTSANSAKTPTPSTPHESEPESPVNPIIEDLSRFTCSPTVPAKPTIFPHDGKIYHKSHSTWDHTLHILSTHLPDLSPNLDKRFHLPPTRTFLSSHTRPDQPLDTRPFRDALHHYSLALLGIQDSSYNYRLVHEFMNEEVCEFVQRVCVSPAGLVKKEWEGVRRLGFTMGEVVEIVQIVAEARFLGVLMIAFKVVGSL